MALKNINAQALKASLNRIKNGLDCSKAKALINDPAPGWQADAESTLVTALTTLTNERYAELKNKIDDYLIVADKISKYKNYYDECISLQNDITYCNNNMYLTSYDKNNKEIKIENPLMKARLNRDQSKITTNENEMRKLANEINSI